MELRIDNVTKKYKTKGGYQTALDSFHAIFTPGIYGLLGANGAGKTTLMRLICDILRPSSGEVRYNGKNICELGEAYRGILGYLPQNFGYYPEFKTKDFLMYIAALKGLPHVKAVEQTCELLELTGLYEERNRKLKTLSGGMRRRLGIAQAMLNNPKVLVLDEPTAGLDPRERVRFRNLISSFSGDKIVLLSTHIVSDVEYIADEILLMKNGSLLHHGELDQILSTIETSVWNCVVTQEEVIQLEQHYVISHLKHADGKVVLRIVSDSKPIEGAILTAPTLEDLYLYYFKEVKQE